MKRTDTTGNAAPSQRITQHIADLGDWRGERLAELRLLILAADADMNEEWKWDAPVWSDHGNVVSAAAFKDHVKVNFFQGAALPDPHGLFNAGLEAKTSRAIDLHEHDRLNEPALQDLVRAAVARNTGKQKPVKK